MIDNRFISAGAFIAFLIFASASVAQWSAQALSDPVDDGADCTIAVIIGSATPDGRIVMWKNRDVANWHQEFAYYDEYPYNFISVNYPFDEYNDEAYGGVNDVGFAIINANALNFADSVGAVDDDGLIMYHALQTCGTVEDFLAYMDTTAVFGRSRPAIFGIYDSFGGAGFLEASKYENFWYDANDPLNAPEGFMVRSNYAYSGSPWSPSLQHRHDKAFELVENAVLGDSVDPRYMFDVVARDMTTESVNPYPLPFDSFYVHTGDTLWNSYRNHTAINREISSSAFVVKGIIPGENPLLNTIWAMDGEPIMTPVVPLWVAAGSVPQEIVGHDPDSPICLRARQLFDYIYWGYPDPYDDLINTMKVDDGNGTGVLIAVRNVEEGYYDYVMEQIESWYQVFPSPTVMRNLQDSIALHVYQRMLEPLPVENLSIQMSGAMVRLTWDPVLRSVFSDSIEVDGYTIYQGGGYSGGALGDSLGFTTVTNFQVPLGTLPPSAFYQVRAYVEEVYEH